jgi:hypothetical protein
MGQVLARGPSELWVKASVQTGAGPEGPEQLSACQRQVGQVGAAPGRADAEGAIAEPGRRALCRGVQQQQQQQQQWRSWEMVPIGRNMAADVESIFVFALNERMNACFLKKKWCSESLSKRCAELIQEQAQVQKCWQGQDWGLVCCSARFVIEQAAQTPASASRSWESSAGRKMR